MSVLSTVTDHVARFSDWLESVLGDKGSHVALAVLSLILPLTLAALPWQWSSVSALALAAVWLVIVLIIFIVGVTGDRELGYEQGFLSVVRAEGLQEALSGLLAGLVLVICNFGAIYAAIANLWPDRHFSVESPSIRLLDFLYFSLVTIVTLGYGDICPISWIGKTLCMLEIVSGILILFIAFGLVIDAGVSAQERAGEPKNDRNSDKDAEGHRDRDAPHRAPLPHHAAYGSVLRDSADQAESDPGEHKSK